MWQGVRTAEWEYPPLRNDLWEPHALYLQMKNPDGLCFGESEVTRGEMHGYSTAAAHEPRPRVCPAWAGEGCAGCPLHGSPGWPEWPLLGSGVTGAS